MQFGADHFGSKSTAVHTSFAVKTFFFYSIGRLALLIAARLADPTSLVLRGGDTWHLNAITVLCVCPFFLRFF